ncbi:MAG: PEP-CTERM sorting domain-containing protein [Thermodesulfobacteriota bacterium]
MKKKILAGLATGALLIGMAGVAQALSLTDVGGNVDDLFAQTILADSGDATELAWVNSVLGGGYTLTAKYDTPDGAGWTGIEGLAGVFAHTLLDQPSYFLIKTGTNSGNPNTHFLFDNLASIDWAVIDLGVMGFTDIENIEKISHIGEFDGGNEVPEPTTMLLMGAGLAGLTAARRKKKA